jgi:aspartate-semialdehyde dehydrogenase
LTVAVVGATGAVGGEFLKLFEDRKFPIAELRLLASSRSAGKYLTFAGKEEYVHAVAEQQFTGVDVAFFSAGASRSREWAPIALDAGATVIDNSSAFRMDPAIPLVVPEINADHIGLENRIISVPNCTAIILCMALAPLRTLGKIQRVIVSTYQSASGAGATVMQYLQEDTAAFLRDGSRAQIVPDGLPPYAFNVFSHNTPIGDDGSNEEEAKVRAESAKILSDDTIRFNVTCIRVPVLRAHCESVTVEFADVAPSEDAVRRVLNSSAGVRVLDDRANNQFPTPRIASHQGDVLVGRIRRDSSHPAAISMFIAGDQLLKGAALNAVQIAENMLDRGRIVPKNSE